MHSLFVDSTSGLVIGLLNSQYEWIEYHIFDEKKPSEIIHFEMFNLLKKYNLELKKMQVFISNGPGSYTGMRLGEGIAQVLELGQTTVYSFYHFDVPRLSGVHAGFWVTNAFKGQVFVYTWNKDIIEKNLVAKNAFEIENTSFGYTLDLTDPLFSALMSTKTLIKDQAPKIFSKIAEEKLREAPYYFRSLEEEFR